MFGAVGAGGVDSVEDLLRPGRTLPRCASNMVIEAGCVISHATRRDGPASVPLRYAAGVLTCARPQGLRIRIVVADFGPGP